MIRTSAVSLVVAVVLSLVPGQGARAAGDPLASAQWPLEVIRAREAWAQARGAGVIVAVVDSGVDLSHPDLRPNLLPGRTFLGCGDAGCGDGDWRSGPPGPSDASSDHGTHVAGTIGAVADNGIGIAGVAPGARILPVKVLDSRGGSSTDVARGIRWAVGQGARVINLSLGTGPADEAQLQTGAETDIGQAVRDARARGALVVAAAGNDALPLCENPAYDALVVCVAAVDRGGARSAFSNAPVKPNQLAVSAPGGSGVGVCGDNVVSTVAAAAAGSCAYGAGYAEKAGTSMATPHVAGVAALLVAQGRSPQATIDAITSTARDPVSGARGAYSTAYGFGIVDAQAAVLSAGAAPTGPPAAENVIRLAGSDRVETAVAVAGAAYGTRRAGGVVVARHDTFADALPGSALAAAVDAPVLLTPTAHLDPRTESAITRFLPAGGTVHLLGGTAALSLAVEGRIGQLGYRVKRYAGLDRFDTAAKVAEDGLGGRTNAVLADGTRHEDALIGGGAAPAVGAVLLLTNGRTAHPATLAYLARHPGGRVIAIGGAAAAAHPTAEALVGPDAPSTSRAVAERLFPSAAHVLVAAQAAYPDALAGGAYAARRGAPLLLVARDALPGSVQAYLATNRSAIAGGSAVGGPLALSELVREAVEDAVAG